LVFARVTKAFGQWFVLQTTNNEGLSVATDILVFARIRNASVQVVIFSASTSKKDLPKKTPV